MKKEMRGIFFPEMIANTIVHRPFPLPGPPASLLIPGGWRQALAPLSSHRNRVGDTQTMPLSLQIYCGWLFSPLECSKKRWKPFPWGSGHHTSWLWLFKTSPSACTPGMHKILQEMKLKILSWGKQKDLKPCPEEWSFPGRWCLPRDVGSQ